jgi:hypothetical protein
VLAWRSLAWIVSVGGPSVRAAVAAVFRRAREERATREAIASAPPPPQHRLRAHGQLGDDEARAIRDRALLAVVIPSAEALLPLQPVSC